MAEITDATVVSEDELIEATRSRNIEDSAIAEPGEHWSVPLQEQHPEVERFKLKNLSATPETMARYLKNQGFEARHRGGWNFSIRKPGEKTWKVIDPDTWTDMLGGDISDVFGDIATILGASTGAVAATIPASVTGPGAVVAGGAGAAGGAAAVETAKQGLAKLVGLDPTAEEAGQRIGEEAFYGATGELGGRALGALARSPLGKKVIGSARRGAGSLLKGTGGLLETPSRAVKRGIEKTLETVPRGAGSRAALRAGREEMKEDIINAAGQIKMLGSPIREAAEEAEDVLSRRFLRTSEIKKAAKSLLDAVETAYPEGESLDPALKMLEKKLPNLSKSFDILGIPITLLPEAATVGQATGLTAAVPGAAPLAAVGALGFAGKGIRAIGLDLIRDTTGRKLRDLAARATGPIAQKLGMPLSKLQVSGPSAYKAAIYTMLQDPEVRKWIRQTVGIENER